jgi:hypothetical protein
MVRVRVPKFLLDRIHRWAGRFDGMDRSVALRCLLDLGLQRSHGKPATVYDPKRFRAHHAKRTATSKPVPPAAPISPRPPPSEPMQRRGRLVLVKNGAAS